MPSIITIAAVLAVLGLLVGLYVLLAPGPRRARAYGRAQKLLAADDWPQALGIVEQLSPARQPATWRTRLRNLAGECHQRALDQALKAGEFEQALDHATQATEYLALDLGEQRNRVVEGLLAELRRLFAAGPGETEALLAMIVRSGKLFESIPPEALFWRALAEVREGDFEGGLTTLEQVHQLAGRVVLDAPLYVGILLHRLGRPQEALKLLADANRIDTNCPFVAWQMGVSIVAAGGDNSMALRALQKALSPRGLLQWQSQPDRLWIEAFPEGRSYVRRLATRYRFVCPLLGGDLGIIVRQGQLALAQASYKTERYQEACDLYAKLLQNSPPTVMLLRGYGLSLAKLGQYDLAYKHLRIAHEQEDPRDPFTAAYLGLCGAMGRPTNPADKPRNVTWGLKLLARQPQIGNAEWAGLAASIHSEARQAGVPMSVEDQSMVCDALASVQAHDVRAAQTYAHLAETFPDAVKPIHAWLYARAAAAHGVTGPGDLDLLARTFLTAGPAREFFERQKWDFGEVEYTYLARSAQQAPGHFPEILGPDYPAQGEAFLLTRSREQERAGQKVPARESVEVLLRLAPHNLQAHDRLACLFYRQGSIDRAVELLDGWQRLAPADHWPLVRQAILEQERGNADRRAEAIDRALGLTRGGLRAEVAYLGARLALRQAIQTGQADLEPGRRLLEECLREQPDHIGALWCLASVRSVQGDRAGLAEQAKLMDRPEVTDGRFHFLGAVCHLAGEDYRRSIELSERAVKEPGLAIESKFVNALARLHLDDVSGAQPLLKAVAAEEKSPSAVYARALLGRLGFHQEKFDEAIDWWTRVEPAVRARWGLDDPARQTVLLAGLVDLETGSYEKAADRFREAGKLGLRDKRLGGLITLALVKAGQRLLFQATAG